MRASLGHCQLLVHRRTGEEEEEEEDTIRIDQNRTKFQATRLSLKKLQTPNQKLAYAIRLAEPEMTAKVDD